MKSSAFKTWRRTLATGTLTMALILGVAFTWAQTTPPPAASTNNPAALEAFKKARDLFQADKYSEAYVENEKALKLDPNYSDAQTLKRILDSRMAESTPTATETTTGPASRTEKLLKPTDISLIRIAEIALQNPDDQKIKGKVDRKTLEKFWDEVIRKDGTTVTADAKNKFLDQKNFLEQVRQIRDSGDTAYMEKVEFTSDPVVLLNFRKNIHPFVIQNCATAGCHGGEKAGNFRLFRGATERDIYTNFYILSQYANKAGKMIDRENSDKSLLLQYGLPQDLAATPHPKAANFRRAFPDANNTKYKEVTTWITGDPARNVPGLAFPTPNYGIIYELPGAAPAKE